MAGNEQLWLDGFKNNSAAQKFNNVTDKIDKETLREVVNEMTLGKESLGEISGFLWRAILLYNDKIGVTMKDENEIKKFHEEIKPILLSLLEESGVKYKINKFKQSKGDSKGQKSSYKKGYMGYLRDWEDEQDKHKDL
jgi:hypothetical protein